jgi:hypothetical protein
LLNLRGKSSLPENGYLRSLLDGSFCNCSFPTTGTLRSEFKRLFRSVDFVSRIQRCIGAELNRELRQPEAPPLHRIH